MSQRILGSISPVADYTGLITELESRRTKCPPSTTTAVYWAGLSLLMITITLTCFPKLQQNGLELERKPGGKPYKGDVYVRQSPWLMKTHHHLCFLIVSLRFYFTVQATKIQFHRFRPLHAAALTKSPTRASETSSSDGILRPWTLSDWQVHRLCPSSRGPHHTAFLWMDAQACTHAMPAHPPPPPRFAV